MHCAKGDELNIRADKNTDSEIVGTMKKGNLCYILADETEEWVYVESGEVRGFVKKEYLQTGKKVNKKCEKDRGGSVYTGSCSGRSEGESGTLLYNYFRESRNSGRSNP